MKKLATGVITAVIATSSYADQCGKVTIADMNWSSATLLAYVDSFILKHGYGCDVELLPGDTMPTGTSMIEKGEPDIAPEMWVGNIREAIDKGVQEGRLRYAGRSLSDGGQEGWWVPDYLVKQYPDIATIEGIKAHAKLFEHIEDPELSMVMGCPAGWGCQPTNENLFKVLGMSEAGFELVDPGSGAGLAGTIAKAYERKKAWLGYYWAPTPVLGKYKMTMVDFGTGVDRDYFYNCLTQADCEPNRGSMYPPADVFTLTTESFASESPQAYGYISNRSVTNAVMNDVLAWMEDNQADGEVASYHFLETYESVWSEWVSAQAREAIKKQL